MRAPFSVHEALVQKFRRLDPLTREAVKDTALDALYNAMVKARGYAETMAKLPDEIMADRIYSRETNAEKLRREVSKLAAQAGQWLDDAVAQAGAALEHVRLDIAEPPAPEANSNEADYEEEIRTTFRGLSNKERQTAFAEALRREDIMTIGAVLRLGLPSLVVGMSETERELRRREWQTKHYPAELDRIDRLGKGMEAGGRARRALDTFARQLVSEAVALELDRAAGA